jgi:hypothetical protein
VNTIAPGFIEAELSHMISAREQPARVVKAKVRLSAGT